MGIFDWLFGMKKTDFNLEKVKGTEEISLDDIKIEVEKINNDSSIIELQEFLSKILDKYAYRTEETIHHYTITFDGENMIISSSCQIPLSEELKKNPAFAALLGKPMTSKHTVPLQEIIKLYYKEHKSTIWLIIETKPNKIEYDNNNGKVEASTESQFILKKELRKDNYHYLSSIIPAFHKIIIAKCDSNHSLSSIDSFPVN